MRRFLAGLVLCLAPALAAQPSLPDGYYLEDAAGGATFQFPVATTFLPNGTMYVAEKSGRVFAVRGDTRLATPVIDLQSEVEASGDRGLIGLTVHPDFETNRYVYLLYVVQGGPEDAISTATFARLTRYTASADGTTLLASSRKVILGETFPTGIPSCFQAHMIGTVAFGTDGSLFVGTGDAASYVGADAGGLYDDCFGPGRLDPSEDIGAFRAQRLESLAGKILRVDPETGLGLASNPFYTGDPADNASRVWAYGLRNPFRFTVARDGAADPALGDPGTVYAADVGFTSYEELSPIRAGENHGWPCFEGPEGVDVYQDAAPSSNGCGTATDVVTPPFYWNQNDPDASRPTGRTAKSVTGGAVAATPRYPADLRDRIVYADFELGWIATAAIDANGDLEDDQAFGTDFVGIGQIVLDPSSNLLHVVQVYDPDDGFKGRVFRLRHVSDDGTNNAPVAQAGASPRQGGTPLVVTFSGSASFDPDGDALTHAWDFGDGARSTLADPQHTYQSAGTYTARLTVADISGATSSTAIEIVARAGSAPTARIETPAEGATFASGQTVRLVGRATDPDQDDATLAVEWDVALTHNAHIHPDDFRASGRLVDYAVPFHGDAGDSYGVRITLTVTDADGLTATDERVVLITAAGERDITDAGTEVAFITAPTGGGSRSLGVISDGVTPLPNETRPALQYDTYTDGGDRALDWVGYRYDAPQAFTRVLFQEGLHFGDGGWFETLRVEVYRDGAWTRVPTSVAPVYDGGDGESFEAYTLAFTRTVGEGIRIIGRPGGTARYISIGELRVFAEPSGTGALPDGWASADVGNTPVAGSAGQAGGTFTVRGGGDVYGRFDGFHYAYQTLAGDGTITARITSVAAANVWAKAGLMVRASLDGDAAHGMMIGTPARGLHLQYRATAGDATGWMPGPDTGLPAWLRLTRRGDELTGAVSDDGVAWTTLGTETISLPDDVLIGLMSTATDFDGRNDLAAAVFTDVSIQRAVDDRPGAADTLLSLDAVYPNPARSAVSARLRLERPGAYTLDVLDALGRRVAGESGTVLTTAPDAVAVDLSGIGPGVYLLRLRDEAGARSTRRLTVVR